MLHIACWFGVGTQYWHRSQDQGGAAVGLGGHAAMDGGSAELMQTVFDTLQVTHTLALFLTLTLT